MANFHTQKLAADSEMHMSTTVHGRAIKPSKFIKESVNMKHAFAIIGILAVLCLALVSCTSTGKGSAKSFRQQEFELNAKGNPTTGYSWKQEILEGNDVIQFLREDYVSDDHPEGMVGVGGTFYFAYKGLKEGTAKVELRYARAFEWNPIERKVVKINIDAAGDVTVEPVEIVH